MILPGDFEDPLLSFHPAGRLGKQDQVAQSTLFLYGNNGGFITGSMLSIDGG
jgi:acetoacetyl-CoA reductase